MSKYLAIGSNLGDRRKNIRLALSKLDARYIRVKRIAPVYETPALLPKDAPSEWDEMYLNTVVEVETGAPPLELLRSLKLIEKELGRDDSTAGRWSPRTIDIDILFYDDVSLETEPLTIPHPGIEDRAFVLDPLKDLNPAQPVQMRRGPFRGHVLTAGQLARGHREHAALIMGVVNVTPDSFSDGGQLDNDAALEQQLRHLFEAGAHIIDIGGESTRPGADTVAPGIEWKRVERALACARRIYGDSPLRPQISVDTRNPSTAEKCLAWDVDIINDVSGLENEAMLKIARDCDKCFVFMHSIDLPASSNTLSKEQHADEYLKAWAARKLEGFDRIGLDPGRLIYDPGLGFGKDRLQSWQILRSLRSWHSFPCRILIGHSRKSIYKRIADASPQERDWETAGTSLSVMADGADIIRVHNVEAHSRAIRAWLMARTMP